MSFLEKNENFIRIKFHSDMKAMSFEERIVHYNNNLKKETLKRLNDYFKSSVKSSNSNSEENPDLFTESTMEVNRLKEDYTEILKLLKDFEFETILKSIYFENNADELFYHLRSLILDSLPPNFKDDNLILNVLNAENPHQNCLKVSDFLQTLFKDKLQLTLHDWNSENKSKHQTVYKLCDWIESKLKELNTEKEIAFILFHYTKYWNVYFSRSNDDIKRIVILNRLSAFLENRGTELLTNVNSAFLLTMNLLGNIVIDFTLPPFFITLDDVSKLNLKVSPGFELQLKRFNKARIDANEYFKDFSELNYNDLISKYIDSSKGVRQALSSTIFDKLEQGKVPTTWELDCFVNLLKDNGNKELLKNDNFFYHFSKRNYMFYCFEY